MDAKVLETHAEWTKPGSFYDRAGGCFKGMARMTREEELEYVRSTLAEEWIEHHGKGYPDLPMDTLVQVRFLHGPDELKPISVEEWSVNWHHDPDMPCSADIVAYRVVTK